MGQVQGYFTTHEVFPAHTNTKIAKQKNITDLISIYFKTPSICQLLKFGSFNSFQKVSHKKTKPN